MRILRALFLTAVMAVAALPATAASAASGPSQGDLVCDLEPAAGKQAKKGKKAKRAHHERGGRRSGV